ncbi:MAG: EamA family transporter [Gemmobacter sp.]
MTSLLLGLFAAFAWGLHDFLVRRVSQNTPAAPLLFVSLLAGCLALAPVSAFSGDWPRLTARDAVAAMASGVVYALACYGIYRAFALGPVRVVAPISGAYPVLSVGWAALSGQDVGLLQWLAVLTIVGGIALVARSGEGEGTPVTLPAVAWAVIASAGYGLTFALGQAAAAAGAELATSLIARIVALAVLCGMVLGGRRGLRVVRPVLRPLVVMGVLDVAALTCVLAAGGFAHPEYAAVAAAPFGVITILLAWAFLSEAMRPAQWAGVAAVFAAIAWLAVG